MARYICYYCGLDYDNEEGPHPYETCVARLNEQIDMLIDTLTTLNKRRRDAQMLTITNERSQQRD